MGFYISVGGVVTFKNAKKLVEVVENVPIDKILVETDSPYLSPTPLRGTRNNSQNLKYIVEKIAQIKQLSPQSSPKNKGKCPRSFLLKKSCCIIVTDVLR